MINEPTAASLAYGYGEKENTEKNIVVIDFDGGALNITLLKFIKDEDTIKCDIKFSYGNSYFRRKDFDNALMDLCIEKSRKSENESKTDKNIDLKGSRTIRLKRACERAKIGLSTFDYTKIHVNNYSEYESIDVYIIEMNFFVIVEIYLNILDLYWIICCSIQS